MKWFYLIQGTGSRLVRLGGEFATADYHCIPPQMLTYTAALLWEWEEASERDRAHHAYRVLANTKRTRTRAETVRRVVARALTTLPDVRYEMLSKG